MSCSFPLFHGIRTIIFLALTVLIIIFLFLIRANINDLKELKIKINFGSDITNDNDHLLLKFLENDEINKYEEFFNQYNLKEGQSLNDNEDINSSFANIDRLSLAIIIILFILIFISLILYCVMSCMASGGGREIIYVGIFSSFILIGINIILLILFLIYLGFFIANKNIFENSFFELYESIGNNLEQEKFKNYYNSFFEFRTNSFIVVIVLPINIVIILGYILAFFERRCLSENCGCNCLLEIYN